MKAYNFLLRIDSAFTAVTFKDIYRLYIVLFLINRASSKGHINLELSHGLA